MNINFLKKLKLAFHTKKIIFLSKWLNRFSLYEMTVFPIFQLTLISMKIGEKLVIQLLREFILVAIN